MSISLVVALTSFAIIVLDVLPIRELIEKHGRGVISFLGLAAPLIAISIILFVALSLLADGASINSWVIGYVFSVVIFWSAGIVFYLSQYLLWFPRGILAGAASLVCAIALYIEIF